MASVESIIRQGKVAYRGIPWDAQKRKKGPTRSFAHESDAWAYARGWERDRDQVAEAFGAAPVRNRRRVLFSEYAMQCAQRADIYKTREAKLTMARVLGARWARLHVDEIDRALINELLAEMSTRLAPGTRRNRISFLRSVFTEAIRDKLITDDPTFDIEMPRRASSRTHRPPTEAELTLILDYFDDWFVPAILLAHDSGLRVAEVAGLRWFRIDFERRTVMVTDVMQENGELRGFPKGKKAFEVPLSARAVAALRKAKLASGGGDLDFVVRRPGGKGFHAKSLASHWARNIRKIKGVGSPKPTFHDLRHAAAHRLVRAGVDMPTLQAFMRHNSLDVTRGYMPDVTMQQMMSALDAVAAAVEPARVVAMTGT